MLLSPPGGCRVRRPACSPVAGAFPSAEALLLPAAPSSLARFGGCFAAGTESFSSMALPFTSVGLLLAPFFFAVLAAMSASASPNEKVLTYP